MKNIYKRLIGVILTVCIIIGIVAFSAAAGAAGTQQTIATGYAHSLALKNDGTVWACGYNRYGQLGNSTNFNTETSNPSPVQVTGLSGVIAINAGYNHSLALKSDGTVWAWGYNYLGGLGDGINTSRYTPAQVKNADNTPLSDVIAISTGLEHSLALKSDGTVWTWGYNGYGGLGDGTTTNRYRPVQVKNADNTPLSGVIAIAAGHGNSLALKSDGTVWAWGENGSGQLGDGTNTDKDRPVKVAGLSGVSAIAAGAYHTLALKNDGTVWAWGRNGSGHLGDGTTTGSNTPVQAINTDDSSFSGVIAIDAGANYSLALKSDGTVWAWGDNNWGQLGDGTKISKYRPMQVAGLSNVSAIAAGMNQALVLKSDGTVWAWGYNGYGGLGDGTTTNNLSPVKSLFEMTATITTTATVPTTITSTATVPTTVTSTAIITTTATETSTITSTATVPMTITRTSTVTSVYTTTVPITITTTSTVPTTIISTVPTTVTSTSVITYITSVPTTVHSPVDRMVTETVTDASVGKCNLNWLWLILAAIFGMLLMAVMVVIRAKKNAQ